MGYKILRSDSAQWPQIIFSFHSAKWKPPQVLDTEGRKGLITGVFFFLPLILSPPIRDGSVLTACSPDGSL